MHNKIEDTIIDKILEATKIIRQAYLEGSTSFPLSTRDLIQLVELMGKFDFEMALRLAVLNKAQSDGESKFLSDIFSTVGLL